MSIIKKGSYYYGEDHGDLTEELIRYSKNNYGIEHTANSTCKCANDTFNVLLNEGKGVAARICTKCDSEHGIGDSDKYMDDAEEVDEMECVCGSKEFKVTSGVALYDESEDVRWFYLGLLCLKCGCMGCYGDWKNEFIGYKGLLANV